MTENKPSVVNQQLSTNGDSPTVMEGIANRIVSANTPQELVLLTQIRGEILKQNNDAADREHRRKMDKLQIAGKLTLTGVTIALGTGLVIANFPTAGFFILGSGLFWLAPDYVKAILKWKKEKGINANE